MKNLIVDKCGANNAINIKNIVRVGTDFKSIGSAAGANTFVDNSDFKWTNGASNTSRSLNVYRKGAVKVWWSSSAEFLGQVIDSGVWGGDGVGNIVAHHIAGILKSKLSVDLAIVAANFSGVESLTDLAFAWPSDAAVRLA